MARPRWAPVRPGAEITSDAIAELSSSDSTQSTLLFTLAVQWPLQASPGNVVEEEDNPFTPLRNNCPLLRNVDHGAADDYQWESGFKSEIPEFHGTPKTKELLDWIVTVEEILEFKRVPMDHCVHVIAMKFRNRTVALWTQLKATRTRLGKPKVMAWDKLKSKLKKTLLPYNNDQLMFHMPRNTICGGLFNIIYLSHHSC